MYAGVVFGLPVDGAFDYLIPAELENKVKIGSRIEASFGFKKKTGYVVTLFAKSNVKNIKPILRLLDENPLLDNDIISLAKKIALYYCCSWGEAIEIALPEVLRKAKPTSIPNVSKPAKAHSHSKKRVIHSPDIKKRWERYLVEIKNTLSRSESVIVLLPDMEEVLKVKEWLAKEFTCSISVSYRKQRDELGEWFKIKEGKVDIVVGTRSAIFSPLPNLGLIIIEEENDYVYKQDQVPHYHAREVAFMRAELEGADIILGSTALGLEMMYKVSKGELEYEYIKSNDNVEVKIIDTSREYKKENIISRYLEDLLYSSLNQENKKVLLFLNRKGFSTYVHCQSCGVSLKCPRCNINLVFYFKEVLLRCHYCNYKLQPIPKICPSCNAGYIKYSGQGIQKLESEISRIFPQARIKILDESPEFDLEDADIFIATQRVLKHPSLKFDLVGALSIDNTLNQPDFRSSEKVFSILSRLLALAKNTLVIQTTSVKHHALSAICKHDPGIFYDEELKQRGELKFPPFTRFGVIKMRSPKEAKVKEFSNIFYNKLQKENKKRTLKIIALTPWVHPKLRGNYYWQIILSSSSAGEITKFIKNKLKNLRHSGIIVTVDIDPI